MSEDTFYWTLNRELRPKLINYSHIYILNNIRNEILNITVKTNMIIIINMLIITKIINIIKKSNILTITRIVIITRILAMTVILAILIYHHIKSLMINK